MVGGFLSSAFGTFSPRGGEKDTFRRKILAQCRRVVIQAPQHS